MESVTPRLQRFRLRFSARRIGAIGTWSTFETTVEAVDLESARLKLYDRWEHISELSVIEVSDSDR